MNPKSSLAVGLLVVGIGAVLFYINAGGAGGREATPPRAAQAADAAPSAPRTGADALLAPTEVASKSPAPRSLRAVAPTADAHDLSDDAGFDTEHARWIDVAISLPAGVPLDDEVALVAVSAVTPATHSRHQLSEWQVRSLASRIDLSNAYRAELEQYAWSCRAVAGSGVVRVPFHPEAREGALVLVSRYVYAKPLRVEFDSVTGPVQLECSLGAYVTGRVIVPAGAEDRGLTSDDFDVELQGRGGKGFGQSEDERDVRLENDLTFELRALAADRKYFVHAACDGLVDHFDLAFEAPAGKHTTLDIPLALGATIVGRVVGDDGEPIADADVEASGKGASAMFGGGASATSAADGTYSIQGVAGRSATVQARADGWLEADEIKVDIVEGQVTAGIDFILSSGNRIAGTVLWPDGKPAQGATVTASKQERGGWQNHVSEASADAQGAFVLTGLGEGPFDLDARLAPSSASEENPDGATDDADDLEIVWESGGTEGPDSYRAFAPAVGPGTSGLVLRLVAPLELAGSVVDDTGAPVTEFEITARPANGPRWGGDSVHRRFEAEDGAFSLAGVYAGDWIVAANADGYSPDVDGELNVHVPSPARVAFVLRRAVAVSGLVVDPSGAPVPNADVVASSGSRDRFDSGSSAREETKTDDTGRFELEGCAPDGLSLVANHENWASSEPFPLEAAPGSARDDVVLTLRIGATITGEVFDAEGQPDAGCMVSASSKSELDLFDGENQVVTDAAGTFLIEHVEPGAVTVVATPSEDDMIDAFMSADEDDAEATMMGVFSQMRMTSIDVADGDEVHVVLGAEPKAPVRITGTVTEAGEPLAETMVLVIEEGGAMLQGMKIARTDDGGRFEVAVDRPGDFVFGVGEDGFNARTQFYVAVPEVEEFVVDLEIPQGRLAGTVFGTDGAPAIGVGVRLSEDGGVLAFSDFDDSNSFVTASDGTFSFTRLRAGTYSLRAGGGASFFGGDEARFGGVVVDGIEVGEGKSVRGIEIHLAEAGSISGTVRDASGAPVASASIFARDASGRVLSTIASCATNGTGQFRYKGLPAGRVWVFARAGDAASAEYGPLDVTAQGNSTVDLTLSPGCYLVINVERDDEPVHARVKVLDDEGRQVNGVMTQNSLESLMVEGLSSKEQRAGPLPAGKYTVHATTQDGASSKKAITVREGQDERRVKLRIR